MNNELVPTIGIEVHVELKTDMKVFSKSRNNYNSEANTNVNEIDLGYPGVLPTLNEEIIKKALEAAMLLNCDINYLMHFDRKNYYYPDLPKGYQITQASTPIGHDGYIEININNEPKKILIERVHIEEDTCKSTHIGNKTLLNYNRAGVPLIEIVTKPVIKTAKEAVLFLERLKELLFYLNISDCKMEEGSMRADVNISLSNSDILGTKCEIKNLGSITAVGTCIEEEIKRQSEILLSGGVIEEETRRYDSITNKTILMRKKEIGNDYRYFPEPDIPYVDLRNLKEDFNETELIMLPNERRSIYLDKGISEINIEKLLSNKNLSDFLNLFIGTDINFKIASNLLVGDITSYLNKYNLNIMDTKLTYGKFLELVNMLDNNTISNKIFKDILDYIMETDDTINKILEKNNIELVNNEDELIDVIKSVLEQNKDSVNAYKSGKDNALKYLMGMIMKETQGKANPKLVNELLLDLLSKDVN